VKKLSKKTPAEAGLNDKKVKAERGIQGKGGWGDRLRTKSLQGFRIKGERGKKRA